MLSLQAFTAVSRIYTLRNLSNSARTLGVRVQIVAGCQLLVKVYLISSMMQHETLREEPNTLNPNPKT